MGSLAGNQSTTGDKCTSSCAKGPALTAVELEGLVGAEKHGHIVQTGTGTLAGTGRGPSCRVSRATSPRRGRLTAAGDFRRGQLVFSGHFVRSGLWGRRAGCVVRHCPTFADPFRETRPPGLRARPGKRASCLCPR